MYSSDFYLQKYEEYLKSLKCIGFSYQNTFPDSMISGEFKYNGKYMWRIFIDEHDTADTYARELTCSETIFQMLEYNKSKTEMDLASYLNPLNAKHYKFEKGFVALPELLGYVVIYPKWEIAFIPQLLREMNIKVTKDTKNGIELILLAGQKDDLEMNVWLDPAQNFLMRFLEIHQSNTSQIGDLIDKSIVLDKFISVKGVKFPTYYDYSDSQVVPKQKVLKGKGTVKIDNITITDNSNPTPFSFKTKIPNGTKVVLYDAQQIEHVWLDGKIVPKTDEVMLAIARGGHKFIPGPNESRFWFIALGLFLMFLGGGLKLYSMLKDNNKSENEQEKKE
jgi:hypothetical protein